MSENQKLLSVCIPTWNRAELLSEQLSLLSTQIIKNELEEKIELVISNNGSEDETENVILKYQQKYNFIKYHNNLLNKGARYNLLKSFQLATGKYLTFLGDDDRYKAESLKKIINCLEIESNVSAVFDSKYLSKQQLPENIHIRLEHLLENFYYSLGNAGLFIVKTNIIQENISKFGFDYFSRSWPQTQLIILGLYQGNNQNILLSQLDLFAESKHNNVMMYNSYYLLRGLYFDLLDAIEAIKNEVSIHCYRSAKKYLKKNILQTTFNILQCGVFIDTEEQKQKTISYIKLNIYKSSKLEKIYLSLIAFVLMLPPQFSKLFSNCFIFFTRGRKGIQKKNKFVSEEIRKILFVENKNKAIRTFDFNS
jgi:glycosyltransferase involved in cell wall biosynthesis